MPQKNLELSRKQSAKEFKKKKLHRDSKRNKKQSNLDLSRSKRKT